MKTKRIIQNLLLMLPFLLTGCKKDKKQNNQIEPNITFHKVLQSDDNEEVSTDYLKSDEFLNSYHASHKYDFVKLTLTSPNPLYDTSNKESPVYGYKEFEFLAAVYDDPLMPFYALLGYNFSPSFLSAAMISSFPPLYVASEFRYALHRFSDSLYESSDVSTEIKIYKHRLEVEGYTVNYGDEHYISSVDYDDSGDRQYHIEFDYFNKLDIPTTTNKVSKKLFSAAVYASSKHPVNKTYTHITVSGLQDIITGVDDEAGTIETKRCDIHYEQFLHVLDYHGDLLEYKIYHPSEFNDFELYREQIATGFPNGESIERFINQINYFIHVYSGFLYDTHSVLSYILAGFHTGDVRDSASEEEYYIDDFRCKITYKNFESVFKFDKEGYLTYYFDKKLTNDDFTAPTLLTCTYEYFEKQEN